MTALIGIISILSFGLSLVAFIGTLRIKGRLRKYANIKNFNKEREQCRDALIALKDLILLNDILDDQVITDIIRQIGKFSNYRNVLNLQQKLRIRKIEKNCNIETSRINKKQLAVKLAKIISIYDREMEEVF
jgi:hypothetical protein